VTVANTIRRRVPPSPYRSNVDALAAIEHWPVGAAAAAVVGPDRVIDRRGPTNTLFGIASVTKPLVAHAALVALEEGSVSLTDAAGPPGATLRHLLSHASGLPFDEGPALTEPGTRRIYSNVGFEVLGEHLTASTGIPVAQYLQDAVLEPLGMGATELRGSPAKDAWSSVDDLVRFATELLTPRLVAPETLRAATTVTFPGLAGILPGIGRMDPNDWGLGFELRSHKSPHWTGGRNSALTFGHFGGSGTFLWVDPAITLGVVCLTDRAFGPWAMEAWPALSDAVIDQWADRPLG
jgi:CubicO group peptidase (beta-lactamase class C family)